jgi:hypothetical protein
MVLAVEEHFYFLLPLSLLLMSRFSKNSANPFAAVPMVSIVLTVFCLALRIRSAGGKLGIHVPHSPENRFSVLRRNPIALGILMSKLVEFPALKLRDKVFSTRQYCRLGS